MLIESASEAAHHLYPLITDLGLILMTAGVAVLLFKKLKQPIVLGYLIAGFIVGSHIDFFPSVKDINSVKVWAEIGVIFLLFSLGLEFSFKKLMRVGGAASITAITQILSMIGIGYAVGQLMGWNSINSIFLGAILSVSSTTIILKALEELNLKNKKFAQVVFGALIVEDIVAILLLVLLSTISVSQQFSGMELLFSMMKLCFFLIVWFLSGIFIIPTLLRQSKKYLNDETALIISLALCLMMVILATQAGFSPALGAFIMGSIIAETTKAEYIEHLIQPVKNLFGAVFFVSVGMLIDPETLVEYWLPVLIITLVTIFGKTFSTTMGALISGQPLKQSVQAGMSLAQIGEFSFIIATLGMNLKVTSDFLYPIVVAVSAVTTFTTPYFIKVAPDFADYLQRTLPRKWTKKIERFSASAQSIRHTTNWQEFIQTYIVHVIIHSVIIVAIILISTNYLLPPLAELKFGHVVAALITLAICAPFIYALSLRKIAVKPTQALMQERKYRGPIMVLLIARLVLALVLIGLLLNNFFSAGIAFIGFCIVILSYFLLPKKLSIQYQRIEGHFLKNFNAREMSKPKIEQSALLPWDEHLTFFTITSQHNIIGKTLYELQLREKLAINIAYIKRGEMTIHVPARNERLFPGDEICVIGPDEQVQAFKRFLDENRTVPVEYTKEADLVMMQVELKESAMIGKTIRDAQIRERSRGMVVGIERHGKRILNPESNWVLEKNDILFIVGDRKLLQNLTKEMT